MKKDGSKSRVAVVEDEEDLRELISETLQEAGCQVKLFANAEDFRLSLDTETPECLILDLMLPGENGLELCKRLRRDHRTERLPLLLLTAKSSELDKVLGFELGADDYVTKPFSPRELAARVRALLRRSDVTKEQPGDVRQVGESLRIDLSRHKVFVEDHEVALTTTEFRLLAVLAENPDWVFSRTQILERLWGHDKFVIDRTIDVHIRHLREKLGRAGGLIKNIRGVGYKIEV